MRDVPEVRPFVDAQLTWDRAMAEALAEARQRQGNPVVVGIIGSEHLRYGHGVPHQLADLGVDGAAVLLPGEPEDCAELTAGVADAVFLLEPQLPQATDRPRLGVLLTVERDEIRVAEVLAGSIAQAAGLMAGDVVVKAAGQEVRRQGDLIDIVGRQAPGTWLPLLVQRDTQTIDVVAKFPAATDAKR